MNRRGIWKKKIWEHLERPENKAKPSFQKNNFWGKCCHFVIFFIFKILGDSFGVDEGEYQRIPVAKSNGYKSSHAVWFDWMPWCLLSPYYLWENYHSSELKQRSLSLAKHVFRPYWSLFLEPNFTVCVLYRLAGSCVNPPVYSKPGYCFRLTKWT